MDPKLKVERAKTSDLIPYANNAKIHSAEQVDQIAASIEQFGFNDPIGVWTRPDGQLEIVEGHGRVMAANLLGIEEVPVIRLDHLDDDGRRAYTHVHNQTTLTSGFDMPTLELELASIPNFDWSEFGFDIRGIDEDDKYTAIVNIPEYEVKGISPSISDLYDCERAAQLEKRINESGLTESEKGFLLAAAKRHIVFNYALIAEYYAQASKEFQELAEDSALVIIDFGKAIAFGYAKLNERLRKAWGENA